MGLGSLYAGCDGLDKICVPCDVEKKDFHNQG